jgi:hypothetical protein
MINIHLGGTISAQMQLDGPVVTAAAQRIAILLCEVTVDLPEVAVLKQPVRQNSAHFISVGATLYAS